MRPDAQTIARFFRFIDFDGPIPEHRPELGRCWLWKGYTSPKGYGQFWFQGRAWWAYVVSYLIFNGALMVGRHRAHLCNNCRCVNPDHVEQQGASENSREGAVRRWMEARAKKREEEPAPF